MIIEPALLLGRVAATLRAEIAPAVGDDVARTQAFMASVILAKLSGELGAADADAQVAAVAHGRAAREVRATAGEVPPPLAAALDALELDASTARWNEMVAQVYACRTALGEQRFERVLGVVRGALRERLDRVLRYAR